MIISSAEKRTNLCVMLNSSLVMCLRNEKQNRKIWTNRHNELYYWLYQGIQLLQVTTTTTKKYTGIIMAYNYYRLPLQQQQNKNVWTDIHNKMYYWLYLGIQLLQVTNTDIIMSLQVTAGITMAYNYHKLPLQQPQNKKIWTDKHNEI